MNVPAEILLTPEVPLFVYGAGEVGRRFAALAREKGYNLIAFFDRKLAGTQLDGLSVLDFSAPSPENLDKTRVVTIICLADGMQHKAVADTLLAAGFRYIIFLPMGLPILPARADTLTRTYNQTLELQSNTTISVVDYNVLKTAEIDPEQTILRREAGRVTLLADAEIVFSEDYSRWAGDATKVHGDVRYSNVNIIQCDFCYPIFDYLSAGTQNYEGYLAVFAQNLEGVHIDIASCNRLFDHFCRELDRGLGFFIEAAAGAVWSEKGYFNLIGGHHRTSFLIFRDHRLIPIRISAEDFERWCNQPCLDRVKQLLKANAIDVLYGPVPHPAFQVFPARREARLPSVYSALYRHIGTNGLAGETVFDLCDDEGYYARLLCRLNASTVIAYAPNSAKAALTSALNYLLYLSRISVTTAPPEPQARCSFLVVMDKAVGLSQEERNALLTQVDALCTGRMLWESYAEDFEWDNHAILKLTNFVRCDILLHIVLEGRRRTIAVFSK